MQTLIQQTVSGHDALLWNKWAPFWVRFQDQNLATKSVQPYLSEHPLCKHVEPSAHSVSCSRCQRTNVHCQFAFMGIWC